MRQWLSALIVNNVWFLCMKQVLGFTISVKLHVRKGKEMLFVAFYM